MLLACSCYSEPYTYGQSPNAAASGLNWAMTNVLPQEAGLTVNGVIYRYTAVKNTSDRMLVHVQNKDAEGTGLIFRETDDWSGLPGSTINKMVSVENIPINRWGDGSIEVDGQGSVVNPTVIYTYKVDTCFIPKEGCANYVPPKIEVSYDLVEPETQILTEPYKKDENEAKSEEKTERRKAADNILSKSSALFQSGTDLTAYYALTLNGGVYKETVALVDKKLPENRMGLRNNFAQQILHDKLVGSQWR